MISSDCRAGRYRVHALAAGFHRERCRLIATLAVRKAGSGAPQRRLCDWEISVTAYLIANVDVTKPEKYEEYKRFSSLAMRAADAKVLVRGGKTLGLEGETPTRTVVLEFRSMAAAKAFYNSWQYRRARNVREGAAVMTMYVVEGA
jgi:uncharacterized protein (DUF1330 family)